ncbi:MAG: M48 family metalloprotease, partial [Myxococcales bacterium]
TAEKHCKDLSRYELSPEQEYYVGRAATANVLARYGAANALSADHPVAVYVRSVGQAVSATAGERVGDKGLPRQQPSVADRPWPHRGYHFLVIRAKTPNAHGMPGGFVVVTTGLLELVKSEDELATILGHEIAHVHRGHGAEAVKMRLCLLDNDEKTLTGGLAKSFGMGAGSIAKSLREPVKTVTGHEIDDEKVRKYMAGVFSDAVGSLTDDMLESSFEPALEFEADATGARFASATGYGAGGIVQVLNRMPRPSGKGFAHGAASTHPDPAKRIAALKEILAREKLAESVPGASLREARFQAAFSKLAPQSAALH